MHNYLTGAEKKKKNIPFKENQPQIPQESIQYSHPRIPIFGQMMKPSNCLIPCEICHKQIVFNKFQFHINSHKENHNFPTEFKQRNHSSFNRNRNHEEILSHNIPFELQSIPNENGHMVNMVRVDRRIFNEGPAPIRHFEIPHRFIDFGREHIIRRPHHNKQKKNKKFKERDIQILFPLVKYEVSKGKMLEEEAKKCSICLSEFNDGEMIRYLTCLHRFHKDCIDAWLIKNITCPLCKKDLIKLVKLGENISH